jgi:hypothetical protein
MHVVHQFVLVGPLFWLVVQQLLRLIVPHDLEVRLVLLVAAVFCLVWMAAFVFQHLPWP